MSASVELQTLIYDRLTSDPAVNDLLGGRIFDRVPRDALRAMPYASFGASDTVEDDDECITGRVETQQVDIWSSYQGGKRQAKQIVDAVKTSLHGFDDVPLTYSALVEMRVTQTRILDDPDGQVSHGVVTVEARIEE